MTEDKEHVSKILKEIETENHLIEALNANWQGFILKYRNEETELIKDTCYSWLNRWKNCPTKLVNNLQSIYLQIIPTLSFTNYRMGNQNNELCRLCRRGNENIKHLLSNCQTFLHTSYIRRHDKALQYIIFNYLKKNKLIDSCPPWYSKVQIKPIYQNETKTVLWDIPEYNGGEENEEDGNTLRPDAKIIDIDEKKIFVLEMSVPWIENRRSKLEEKVEKYVNIVQSLKITNPMYKVKQLTFIIDGLGGYSKDLSENLKELKFDKDEIRNIQGGMQKIVLSEASVIIDRFKMLTKD